MRDPRPVPGAFFDSVVLRGPRPRRVGVGRRGALGSLVLAAVISCLIVGCSETDMSNPPQGLDFTALQDSDGADTTLPPLQDYAARDGSVLQYRHYPADSSIWLVLIHGSAADSVYLKSFAQSLASAGVANVVTPDLRGHGPSPQVRGDIAYIDQLEDDLADLVKHLRAHAAQDGDIVIGGHSSGGGLALRFAGSEYGQDVAGYLLLAPYFGHAAPTTRQDSGGWAQPRLLRIVPIALANALGIRWFNGVETLRFNLPEAHRTGRDTLAYSYRLMTGFAPRDYATDLAAVDAPALLLVGTRDEAFHPERYERTVAEHSEMVAVEQVDGASHLGLVMQDATTDRVARWLAQFQALR